MDGLMALDSLVAGRSGDGLHPRLRALLEERQHIEAAPGVVALDRHRAAPLRQAGPYPTGVNAIPSGIKGEGVMPFPDKRSRTLTRIRPRTSSIK